jgi:hypothetical protein
VFLSLVIPGTGSMYAGRVAAGCGWLASAAAAVALLVLVAFPAGGLSSFGVFVVGLICLFAVVIWGGAMTAAHKAVRAWNREHGVIS